MYHVVGLSPKDQERIWPLESGCFRFRTFNFHSLGYFLLLSPLFEKYAQRDAGIGICSINVMFVLKGHDLVACVQALTDLEHELGAYPNSWRPFLGTHQTSQRAPAARIEPLLFRSRALRLIAKLRTLAQAASGNKYLVYGNGVAYQPLCGIKLPAGTLVYS